MSFDALVVFAKEPVPGKVKTRLAVSVGAGFAARLYGLFLKYLSFRLRKLPPGLRLFIAVDPPRARGKVLGYFHAAAGARAFGQKGRGLGARMLEATREARRRGARKVIVIGSDCLEVSPAHLSRALALLEKKDLVLGPAKDGGYYLLGWKRPEPACFRDVAWSGPDVMKKTVRNVRAAGFAVGFLPVLSDLDEAKDLKGLGRKLAPHNPATAALRKALREAENFHHGVRRVTQSKVKGV